MSGLKIAVLGPSGQIGSEILFQIPGAQPLFKSKLNLLNSYGVKEILSGIDFDLLINAAGIIDLDYCEANPQEAEAINSASVIAIAEYCQNNGKKLIHLSDSMVFDGILKEPYWLHARPNPINYYGISKYNAERAILNFYNPDFIIIRSASVFGPALGRSNFIEKLINSAMRVKEEIKIPSYRILSPTSSRIVAQTIKHLIANPWGGHPPLLQVTSYGEPISQSELAVFILENIPSLSHIKVIPIAKAKSSLPRIPPNTSLAFSNPFNLDIPHWRGEIEEYLLNRGYARPLCALEVENDADFSVSKVWEKLNRGEISIENLVRAARIDRGNWLAGIDGPGRKAKKGFWKQFSGGEEKEEE